MRARELLLVLLLALATTELVKSQQEKSDLQGRDLEETNNGVEPIDDGDDAEAEAALHEMVRNAADKVCEAFSDGGSKRAVLLHMRKRGWLKKKIKKIKKKVKKVWKKIKGGAKTIIKGVVKPAVKKLWAKIKRQGRKWLAKQCRRLLGKRSVPDEFSEAKRDDLWAMARMRRESGDAGAGDEGADDGDEGADDGTDAGEETNDCNDLDAADLAEAMETLSAVSEAACNVDDGEE